MLPGTVVKEMLAEKVEAIEFSRAAPQEEGEGGAEGGDHAYPAAPRLQPHQPDLRLDQPGRQPDGGGRRLAKKADNLLALLRKSIGTLPVVPVALKNPPRSP